MTGLSLLFSLLFDDDKKDFSRVSGDAMFCAKDVLVEDEDDAVAL